MRKLLLFLVLLATAGAALAQPNRTLPAKLQRGTVGEQQALPLVTIDGKSLKLAPGGVIFDENNRTVVHGALPPGAAVAYTTDMNGDIGRIYVLTPAEQQMLDQRK
jgi:hypothetical protein